MWKEQAEEEADPVPLGVGAVDVAVGVQLRFFRRAQG